MVVFAFLRNDIAKQQSCLFKENVNPDHAVMRKPISSEL